MSATDGWVVRLATRGDGPRVAVKDAIDVAGLPTYGGSPALSAVASPAGRDAECVRRVRAGGGVLVGKTALTELCWFASGRNDLLGTPVNPLDPGRLPGGSSSGSAVVVARGEADVGLGTDTGGSVRIPAACCGIAGLKTTWGRIPLDGVLPLSPSLDTVGPLAPDVAGLAVGLRLLDPAAGDVGTVSAPVVVRVRPPVGVGSDVDAAVDLALRRVGWRVREVEADWWTVACDVTDLVLLAEAARGNAALLEHAPLLSAAVVDRITRGLLVDSDELAAARRALGDVRANFLRLLDGVDGLDGVDALALPTLPFPAPPLAAPGGMTALTVAVNGAGFPALALPVPLPGSPVPASLQLVARPYEEERLLALGAELEAASGPADS